MKSAKTTTFDINKILKRNAHIWKAELKFVFFLLKTCNLFFPCNNILLISTVFFESFTICTT